LPELRPTKPDEVTRVLKKIGFTRFARVEATLFITILMEGGQQCQYINPTLRPPIFSA